MSKAAQLDAFAATWVTDEWTTDLAQLFAVAQAHQLEPSHVRLIADRVGTAARAWMAAGEPTASATRDASRRQASIDARNWLATGWVVDADALLHRMRMDGLLRASTYRWSTEFPPLLLGDLERLAGMQGSVAQAPARPSQVCVGLSSEYVKSLRTLWTLAPVLARSERALVAELRSDGAAGVLGLLATVEMLFADAGLPPRWAAVGLTGLRHEKTASLHELRHELSDAATYACALFSREVHPLDAVPAQPVADVVGAAHGRHLRRLRALAVFPRMREWEEMVDVHGYEAKRSSRQEIVVEAPDPRYEQAIRHGYIYAGLQRAIAATKVAKGTWSLTHFATTIEASFPALLQARRVETPVPRYRVELVEEPMFFERLRAPQLFGKEAAMLESLIPEHLVRLSELQAFMVVDGVSLWHFVLVQRFFALLGNVLRPKLVAIVSSEPEVALRSMLPTFAGDTLRRVLALLLGSTSVDAIIALLTASAHDARFDLQYQPLLRLPNDHFALCLFVLGDANLVRNLWQATGQRIHLGVTPDPAETLLASIIRGSGHDASTGLPASHNGQKAEIDVFACIDGVCLAVEFKRAL